MRKSTLNREAGEWNRFMKNSGVLLTEYFIKTISKSFGEEQNYLDLRSTSMLLNWTLQATYISIRIPSLSSTPLTLASVYIPPDQKLALPDFDNFCPNLPHPIIIVGDFNAHNPAWGGIHYNHNGKVLETYLLDEPNLCYQNNPKTPTHFNASNGTFSFIYLTLCTTYLFPAIRWNTHPDLCNSDHFRFRYCLLTYQSTLSNQPPNYRNSNSIKQIGPCSTH